MTTDSSDVLFAHHHAVTIEVVVHAPIAAVWQAWTTPAAVMRWNAASDDWHTTASTIDLRVGGEFSSRMEAKDGSMGFDFSGRYTTIVPHTLIESVLDDERPVRVEFLTEGTSVILRETFAADASHDVELQRQGWHAILLRFKEFVETRAEPPR